MCDIKVLFDGYSIIKNEQEMKANCTCTLVRGIHNIIIDTMTPWDSNKIITSLKKENISTDDINYVVSTHGHSDHLGNNHLFLKAKHIVGFNISYEDSYYMYPFDKGEEYIINDYVKILPTPGHTLTDITVLAVNTVKETVAITGDLFEKVEDIEDQNIWMDAGSEDPIKQRKNRFKIANLADWIIPGHGPKFKVTDMMRQSLATECEN